MECPCTRDCPRRAPGCGANCKEYREWKDELKLLKQKQRPPNTVGFWDWKSAQLVDDIKQRKRGKGGRRGGGTSER